MGDSATIADFAVFNLVQNFFKPLTGLDKFESIAAFCQRIAGEEKIAAYLASDRRPDISLPAHMHILSTPEECK